MTPLYLASLPLILITLAPEVSLNSVLQPGADHRGLALAQSPDPRRLRHRAPIYFLPVLLPTLVYAWIALRWAVDLFRREDVVFREAEAFDLKSWLRHLVRDKEPTPNAGSALFCFALMLSLAWFLMQALGTTTSPVKGMVLGHLAFILGPPVLLAVLAHVGPTPNAPTPLAPRARSGPRRRTGLELEPDRPGARFPRREALPRLGGDPVSAWRRWPARSPTWAWRSWSSPCCRRSPRNSPSEGTSFPAWSGPTTRATAIVLSSLLFGFLHVLLSLFQQLFGATILGLVLGLLAVRTRSLWPGVLFHFINNALGVLTAEAAKHPRLTTLSGWLFRDTGDAIYRTPVVAATTSIAFGLLYVLWRSSAPPKSKDSTDPDLFADLV